MGRRLEVQAFRFTSAVGQRLQVLDLPFRPSAILQWARLQAPGPRPRRFTYTVVQVQLSSVPDDARQKGVQLPVLLLISVAKQICS